MPPLRAGSVSSTIARSAVLFPGQGVTPRRADTARARPDLVEALDDLLGHDAFADAARRTASAQPAIYCASLALGAIHPTPDFRFFAGHSLGEITALAAAGWLDEIDGLRLVIRRGELMEDACARRPSGMIAILGVPVSEARALALTHEIAVASDNAPGQVVLSGDSDKLDALVVDLAERQIASLRLPVQGGFHSPAMAPAVAPFREALAQVRFTPTKAVVMSASKAAPFERVRDELATALDRPVRWRETLLAFWNADVRSFATVGPGRAVAGMVRKTLPDATLLGSA